MVTSDNINITYSTDTSVVDDTFHAGDCLHLLCKAGSGTVTYGERTFEFGAHSMIVISKPEAMSALNCSEGMDSVLLIAPLQFLYNQLPANHFGIGGCIDLWDNPVIPLTEDDEEKILTDFAHLGERIGDTDHVFYKELIGSLALTMVYDIFQAHAKRDLGDSISERNADIVSRLVDMLSSGKVKEYRDVAYYADQLHVSPKYLGQPREAADGPQRDAPHRPAHCAPATGVSQQSEAVAHADCRHVPLQHHILFHPICHQASRQDTE